MKILLLFLFINASLYSQVKKEYLYNEFDQLITEEVFKKKLAFKEKNGAPKYYFYITENDSTAIVRLFLFENKGILKEGVRDKVVSDLGKITGVTINNDDIIIINFFIEEKVRNQRPCIDHYTSDRDYKKFIKKNPQIKQFFITRKGYNYDKEFVYEDVNYTIQSLFPYAKQCGNYIIIKPNGHFLRRFSEYRQRDIPQKVKADW